MRIIAIVDCTFFKSEILTSTICWRSISSLSITITTCQRNFQFITSFSICWGNRGVSIYYSSIRDKLYLPRMKAFAFSSFTACFIRIVINIISVWTYKISIFTLKTHQWLCTCCRIIRNIYTIKSSIIQMRYEISWRRFTWFCFLSKTQRRE